MENSSSDSKKQRLIVGLLVLFLAVGLAGGGWWWYYTSKYVSTDDARISGNIVSISAKLPGRIVELLVKEGDKVQAGQVIAKIDAREVLAQKQQAEAALAAAKAHYEEVVAGSRPQEIEQARAAVEQARANLDNAEKNYQRMQKLYSDGAISASQLDNAQTAYAVAKETYAAASEKLDLTVTGSRAETIKAAAAQVKQAEAALEAALVAYENTTVISPVSGTVALKSVNNGEVVAAGQPLVTVIDPNDLWVNARIEETKISRIRQGALVEYTVDSYPGITFTGMVYDIGTAANSVFALIPTENSSGNFTKVTQRIPIKITLPTDTNYIFRPGASVIVKIHAE